MNTISTEVGVSLPGNYSIDWTAPKEACPRMQTHGWTNDAGKRDTLHTISNKAQWHRGGWGWTATTRVEDAESDTLPDTLFVVIYCSGQHYNEGTGRDYEGGSSWGVACAFIDRQKAEAYAVGDERKWQRRWVVEVERFS